MQLINTVSLIARPGNVHAGAAAGHGREGFDSAATTAGNISQSRRAPLNLLTPPASPPSSLLKRRVLLE